jgi:hypothetical protein
VIFILSQLPKSCTVSKDVFTHCFCRVAKIFETWKNDLTAEQGHNLATVEGIPVTNSDGVHCCNMKEITNYLKKIFYKLKVLLYELNSNNKKRNNLER